MENISRRIIITGATSELATSLINQAIQRPDYKLLLVSRKPQGKPSFECVANVVRLENVDLVDITHHRKLFDIAKNLFDGPFSVVHFAGDFWLHKPFINTDFSEIRYMFESHYLTLCSVAKAITPLMITKGGGRLVALSCNSVSYNYPDMAPFTCAKAAIECFVKCFSNEHSEYNISATAIELPTMRTNRVIKEKPSGDHKNYVSPDELSQIILDQVLTQAHYFTGNVMRLFKHSSTFYNQGYFQRNPRV